jgi:hypothetical protein
MDFRVLEFVRRRTPVQELQDLASHFSPPPGESGFVRSRVTVGPRAEAPTHIQQQRDAEYSAACDAAEGILDECAGLASSAPIPLSAIRRFDALAQGVTFAYRIWPFPHPEGAVASRRMYEEIHQEPYVSLLPVFDPSDIGRRDTKIGMTVSAERGPLVKALVDYFLNPARDRLKRCGTCRRWFVDQTRNKSQLRCSSPCTVAWWTRRRRREAGHSEYRP